MTRKKITSESHEQEHFVRNCSNGLSSPLNLLGHLENMVVMCQATMVL